MTVTHCHIQFPWPQVAAEEATAVAEAKAAAEEAKAVAEATASAEEGKAVAAAKVQGKLRRLTPSLVRNTEYIPVCKYGRDCKHVSCSELGLISKLEPRGGNYLLPRRSVRPGRSAMRIQNARVEHNMAGFDSPVRPGGGRA